VLATLGLIRIEPGRGTFVTLSGANGAPPQEHWRFSKQYTLEEVYQFRFITEGYAARRAAMVATDEDVQRLREILSEYKDATRKLDLVTSAQRDFDLHHQLIRMSQNRILDDAHSVYRSVMLESQRLPAARHDRLWEALVEHERVVEAVAMRDPDGASYYMRLHITRAADRAGITLVEVP
jgi:GntR family transcriptional repressor for pyruvate dehydrogenase complex